MILNHLKLERAFKRLSCYNVEVHNEDSFEKSPQKEYPIYLIVFLPSSSYLHLLQDFWSKSRVNLDIHWSFNKQDVTQVLFNVILVWCVQVPPAPYYQDKNPTLHSKSAGQIHALLDAAIPFIIHIITCPQHPVSYKNCFLMHNLILNPQMQTKICLCAETGTSLHQLGTFAGLLLT